MKRTLIIYSLCLLLVHVAVRICAQENSIISHILREPVQELSAVNENNSLTTIEYYDSAGRLIQKLQKGISPDKGDLANYIVYNTVGQKSQEYLPFPFSGNNGAFVSHAKFESSGSAWSHDYCYEPVIGGQLREVSGLHLGGKNVTYKYRLSTSAIPELNAFEFRMQGPTTLEKRIAATGAYQVTWETDEDGHQTLLFVDNNERTVLKRQIGEDGYHDTYSVYDNYDRLCCVLPPAAVDGYTSFNNQSLSEGNYLDLYAYFYIYDDDNQCVEVKYPGADWIYTVYDGDHRPILIQDANRRVKGEWSFIKYDGLGRAVVEGTVKDSRSREELAALYRDVLIRENYRGASGSCMGYSDNVKLGQGGYTFICVRYYDTYDFTELTAEWPSVDISTSVSAKGLQTGVFESVLNLPDKGRYTVSRYDDKARLLTQSSKETLSGNSLSTNYNYNFQGAMIQSESHYDNRYSLKSNYTYDHAAREKSSTYALGYGATRHTSPLRTFNYDSYGRVIEKQLQGDKVAVMYNYQNDGTLYNIISTSRFNETLYYGNSMLPYQLSRCYNGNIADISISQDGRSYFYHFDYDEFNRLTSGMMYGMSGSRLKNDEFYSYDKIGNITSLYRLEEAGTVNGLDIHYRGNQLLKVTDDNKSFHGTYDFAIYPDLADSEQEYYYDGNGNETANLDKNIVAVRYNILNLPDTVQFGDGNRIVNYYLSSGIKLGSISRTYTTPLSVPLDKITNSTDPFVETKEWRNGEMHYKGDVAERIDIQDGYLQLCVNKTSGNLDSLKSYAYVCDHLGSVRQVCDAVTGNVVQSLEYYPSGLIFRSTNYDLQPDKYTGKELISMHGLNQYYSKARMQEFQIPHFTTRDPLCEKYYDLSPYGYCAGNPMRYVDYKGDSISLAGIQQLDQQLNTNYTQTLVNDLQLQTGLTITIAANGNMSYAKDTKGNPIVAVTTDTNGNVVQVGSVMARTLMTGAIDHKDWVSVAPGKSGVVPGTNSIGLNFKQINGFINGTVGMDNKTLGWGMTFMHELHHTQVGGGLHDTPGNPGPVVIQMNTIRSELNTLGGNYGQRLDYAATHIGAYNYIPFSKPAQSLLSVGLVPVNTYVKFK